MNEIKWRLKAIRDVKKLSQEDVAKRLGISTETYSRKEREPRKFYIKELVNLAKILGITKKEFKDLIDIFFDQSP